MAPRFVAGQAVQTPLGKGLVRELRNGGRLLVEIDGRAVVLNENDIAELREHKRRTRPAMPPPLSTEATAGASLSHRNAIREIDLHGLTIADALHRAEQALNDALLADLAELRLIHGRSGGRIRAALHRRLAEIPSVRAFALDPRNQGVTIVHL